MKPRPIIRYVRPLTVAVVGLGIAAITYGAASDRDNGSAHSPLGQILALLTDRAVGLAEIKREIQAIERMLTPPTSLKLSTGSFGLPGNAMSVDWEVLNNSATTQTVTVTVFRVPGDGPKTVAPPGPLTLTVLQELPGEFSLGLFEGREGRSF